ncbi:MAG: NAD(P)(+) transhydrogenase (Re/Si-specific) subunit beta [Betaproteobacteria bacterium]|jgi:NAD(P) transhydrogenase subunit beta|nr:NAD(P)(+) transhydrogenase (Re/Si-specific) subunit beta [Betaproteobacteria bacterium]NBY52227.1 NAD(P)(+) transhydrogenase (Re/Si-specific) subunit beta [Betaproteobacteria bacterium]NCA24368.1 NAD(P)(+) transhydrogenase (Re/Si-specific) subunit beta [Betaproteobacteria bacterium]NCU85055.1 NAD(P)(+) transhydrogenase (Re/Si-specific) subunit beta [Betaproteobacteria bacterium]NDF70146.1 NAD(P)(+) transhydrogenase (Re/Si-specific) subunit beta [Betaproteobacteria bacterium]
MDAKILVNAAYFAVAVVFILGLKAMSSPLTARKGIVWAGYAMVAATLVTFLWPGHDGAGMHNLGLMVAAIAIGGAAAWWSGKKVAMTDMPQMVAIYNGMGGGAAAAIAALEFARGDVHDPLVTTLAVIGSLIGSVAFSGSCIAFAKLQGIMEKTYRLPAQNAVNVVLAVVAVLLGAFIVAHPDHTTALLAFYALALFLGIILTTPIGGADMPVVISLLNAFTGLAVGFEGFVLGNPALIVAGIVVGASGTLLTQLMAKAMNRPIANVIFTPMTGAAAGGGEAVTGTMKETSALDAASMMRFGSKVIVIPGYGMAVAGAQHKVWEMAQLLEEAGVECVFAIHPVAGRMPGHMNVLLAEAGVPYDKILDLDEINSDFPQADVALVIGANDVVNPVARTDKSSPIYGMPILDADRAQNCIVIKRGKGAGYSGIENALFYADNCRMLYGSAQQAIAEIIHHIKTMEEA